MFRNALSTSSEESYVLSLYYGIDRDALWKMMSGSVADGWTAYSFSDDTWSDVTLGSGSAIATDTQYFRKQFVGLTGMAAYDVRLYYKAGIIAYINGAEVYRDNMPSGVVSSTTAATEEYPALAYRGFIRPGSEVADQQSILAVEIHFYTSQTSVDFNAYLAIVASSVSGASCFIYGDSVSITLSDSSNKQSIFDFSGATYDSIDSITSPVSLSYSFSGPLPFVNSIRIWSTSDLASSLETFAWQGLSDTHGWIDVVTVSNVQLVFDSFQIFSGYFYGSLYKNYHLTIMKKSDADTIHLYEMQPLICAISVPTSITYALDHYDFYIHDMVTIKPEINEFSSCIPIATSDKSELYMGYATINGDMSGGFAPIADVPKTKLFAFARWLNKNREEKNAIPEAIILKKPGAELAIDPKTGKPLIAEDALMPYEFLDEVIWRIENKNEGYQDLVNTRFVYETHNQISKEQKTEWLDKFFKRMSTALYKWSILPPSVIVESRSINKYDYRQPITSSKINYKGVNDNYIESALKDE